jgi:hypothetical protein
MTMTRPLHLAVSDGTHSAVYGSMTYLNIAAGDVAFFNKNLDVLTSTSTPTSDVDNDTIYVAQGLSTGLFLLSPRIQVANVTKMSAVTYTAPVNQVTHVGSNGSTGTIAVPDPAAADPTLYALDIIFSTDQRLLPQKQDHKRVELYFASTATAENIADAFVAKINADPYLSVLVTAAKVTQSTNFGISITGKAVAADPAGIDKFDVVSFKVFTFEGFGTTTPIVYTTASSRGSGSGRQVKDVEFKAQVQRGFGNRRQFPVQTPTSYTSTSSNYDIITIEYFDEHEGDHQNQMKSPATIVIAIVTGSTATAAIKAVLNSIISHLPDLA